MSICIQSKYLGALWAANILKDWGCDVDISKPATTTKIVVRDDSQGIEITGILNIVLIGTREHNAHLLARSGVLSTFGQKENIFVPKYVVESVVANALSILCLQHLHDSHSSSTDQTFELHILDLLKYFGAFFISAKANRLINSERGTNLLEGGAPFYSLYPCREGYLAVGNLQPKFYKQMIRGLPLSQEEKQHWGDNQMSQQLWPQFRKMLRKAFSTKTASQWEKHYEDFDTCITEVKRPFRSQIVEPRLTPLPKL